MASPYTATSNPNDSTFGDGTRDYTSIVTWEAATDIDMVTATAGERLLCYNDGAVDETAVLAGGTTDSSYHRDILSASGEGHGGVVGGGFVWSYTGSTTRTCSLNEDYATLFDIELSLNTTAANFRVIATQKIAYILAVIVSNSNGASGTSYFNAINGTCTVVDFLAYENEGKFQQGGALTLDNATLYNNSVSPTQAQGCTNLGSSFACRNVLADNIGTSVNFSGTMTGSNNASSDTSTPGTGPRDSQTFTFVNAGAGDMQLSDSDTGAKDFGIDLSAASPIAFDEDLAGDTWSTWDIGAFTNVTETPGGGGLIHKRSFPRALMGM